MAPSSSNPETNERKRITVTVEGIVTHLNAEKHFPAAIDLDVGQLKVWIRALNIGIPNKAVKLLAPKVLEELYSIEDVNVEDVAIYQQRHAVKRVEPVIAHFWPGRPAPVQTPKHRTIKAGDLSRSAYEFLVKRNIIKRETTHYAAKDAPIDDGGSEVKGDKLMELVDDDNVSDEAAKELKKAKKAAKKAKKLIRALEHALPPMGKMGKMSVENEDEDKDDGNDSDWSQSSWNPSWASDEEESEEL